MSPRLSLELLESTRKLGRPRNECGHDESQRRARKDRPNITYCRACYTAYERARYHRAKGEGAC